MAANSAIISAVPVIHFRPSHKFATTAIANGRTVSPFCSFFCSWSPSSSLLGGSNVVVDDDDDDIGNDATMGNIAGPQSTTVAP